MSTQFPLAGLLRFRRMQQDQAANELAQANLRRQTMRDRRAAAQKDLRTSASAVGNSAALMGIAAARASSQSMLASLDALSTTAEADLAAARKDYTEARRQAVGLEKLEGRHEADQAIVELKSEQGVLDEIAAGAWHHAPGRAIS